jgi:phenylacetate-CoA ligase
MSDTAQYWNPYLETLPLERLQEIQLKKFQRIVAWAYENSPYYRRLYSDAGVEPGDIKSMDDVRKVPATDKAKLKEAQVEGPAPYGSRLCVPIEHVSEFRQTSGTTGTPVYQADTWQDWEWWAECWSYILWAQGYRSSDRVFLPFGYNIFVAFWAGHYAAEKMGCEVVPGGVLDTAARVLKVQELGATAMMGTPTYILSMADVAKNRLGVDAAKMTIDKITCAGEPGASIPTTKKRMQDAWGAKVYDHAGATEIGAWSYECAEQPGGMHVNQGMFLVEIEDLATGELITEPGRKGKMIITALDRMAQPCIRFDSKDLIQWAADPCPCGRSYQLVEGGVLGRADDITKVKGVLLSPTAIEEVVRGFDELADEYEVLVERPGDTDKITLKIEFNPGAESQKEEVLSRLKDQLRLKTNLGYVIEVHPAGSLQRWEVKARRFKDERHLH